MNIARYAVVDVFTDRPLSGNPLTVVMDEAGRLQPSQMAQVAIELNLSETTFVRRPEGERADWWLRSFTAGGAEVTGAGHNALGAWWWLAATDRAAPPRARQLLGDRVLPVHLSTADADPAALRDALATVGAQGCYLFTTTAADGDAYARFFNPTVGILEDPATGSAAGPLAQLLHDRTGGRDMRIVQGVAMGRPSRLCVRVTDTGPRLTGRCALAAEGTLYLA